MARDLCMTASAQHHLALRAILARIVAKDCGLARGVVAEDLRILAILFGDHEFSLAVFRERLPLPLAAFFAGAAVASSVTDCAGFFFI